MKCIVIFREDTWNIETIDKFAELVNLATWKPLVAKVRGYKERPVGDGESRRQSSLIPCIDLYDKASNKVRNKEFLNFLNFLNSIYLMSSPFKYFKVYKCLDFCKIL